MKPADILNTINTIKMLNKIDEEMEVLRPAFKKRHLERTEDFKFKLSAHYKQLLESKR